MTHKIDYQGRESGKRRISRDGRKRMAIAGAEALARWRAGVDTRANALQVEVDTFRSNLLRECGENPSATRIALVESATTTLAAILRIRNSVIRGPKSKVMDVTERSSWLAGTMIRLLNSLNALKIAEKSRPNSIEKFFSRKVGQDSPNQSENASQSTVDGPRQAEFKE